MNLKRIENLVVGHVSEWDPVSCQHGNEHPVSILQTIYNS